jgi:hypothetical protein
VTDDPDDDDLDFSPPMSDPEQPTMYVEGHDPVIIECIRLAARGSDAEAIVSEMRTLGVSRDDLETVANAAVIAMQIIATDSESVNMSDPDKLVTCLVARYVDEDIAVKIARSFPVVLLEELEASREDIPPAAPKKRSGCGAVTGVIVLAMSAVATWIAVG